MKNSEFYPIYKSESAFDFRKREIIYQNLKESLEELRKKVKEEEDKTFLVCVGNKAFFNFT